MTFENFTQATTLLHIPQHVWEDYVQIGFLLILVMVGVPTNVISFVRTFLTLKRVKGAKSCHLLLFKLHLAIADLLILLMYATSRAVWLVTLKWMAGDFLCKFFKFCHTFALCCASYLVTVVALDRLQIISNMRQKQNYKAHRTFQIMLNVCYIMAVIFSLPQFYVWETINPFVSAPDWAQCVTIWASERINSRVRNVSSSQETFYSFKLTEQMYSVGNMLFTFYVPFAIITISYWMVWLKFRRNIKCTQVDLLMEHRRRTSSMAASLKKHSTSLPSSLKGIANNETPVHRMMGLLVVLKAPTLLRESESSMHSYSLNTLLRAKRVAAKKAAYVIVAYLLFWCPYNILGMISLMYPTLFQVTSLFRVLYDFIVINAVVNPFIYGI